MGYVETLNTKEPVTASDVNASLKTKFYDYGRLPESRLKKEIEKCIEAMVKATNGKKDSSRKYYIKSDFYPSFERPEVVVQSADPIKSTQGVEIFDTDEGLMMNVKMAPNSLNTMLPFLKAKEEANKSEEVTSDKTEKSENKVAGGKRVREVEPNEKGANKRQKTQQSTFLNKKSYQLTSTKRFSDLGGISDIIEEIKKLVDFPLRHPEVFEHLGVTPPRGILLCGQPGSGKTALAHSI